MPYEQPFGNAELDFSIVDSGNGCSYLGSSPGPIPWTRNREQVQGTFRCIGELAFHLFLNKIILTLPY